jgi:hypothetical protein
MVRVFDRAAARASRSAVAVDVADGIEVADSDSAADMASLASTVGCATDGCATDGCATDGCATDGCATEEIDGVACETARMPAPAALSRFGS